MQSFVKTLVFVDSLFFICHNFLLINQILLAMKKRILTLGLFVAMMLGANSVTATYTIECTNFEYICEGGHGFTGTACGGTFNQRLEDIEELAEMLC
ncbi:MAG: hypothetical protein EA361_03280 [Bacteroidetes bacterium]|nr:MAG: hypothetical protein EA361_03280 [Bacteroidota bacterium]